MEARKTRHRRFSSVNENEHQKTLAEDLCLGLHQSVRQPCSQSSEEDD